MMGRVTICSNLGEDSTSVSNIFIDEYMHDANDAQIKIYLYLLRMMSANMPTSVSDLADKFNHTEKDVTRALKYWEGKGLISLEYDGAGNLTGIHMEDIVAHRQYGRRKNDAILRPVPSAPAVSMQGMPVQQEEDNIPPKPAYTAEQLRNFKNSEGNDILKIAELYFARPLNPSEMRTVLYIHDELGFSDNLLDYLMQYCVDNHKKDFRYMEKVAIGWSQKGIKTPKQARGESYKHDGDLITIMRALGMENSPTEKEVSFINRWRRELGFSIELILEACDKTVLAVQRGRLKYCDGILQNWHDSGLSTREDIARADAAFSAEKARKKAKASVSSIDTKSRLSESSIRPGDNRNRFNQFEQNTYNFAELEERLRDN